MEPIFLLSIKLFFFLLALPKAWSKDLVDLTCVTDSDCSLFQNPSYNSICSESKCVCKDKQNSTVECMLVEAPLNNLIGGPCPCPQRHSVCNAEHQICYCDEHYVATDDQRRCIKGAVNLGERCEMDYQCTKTDRFSHCNQQERQCTCLEGFVNFSDECRSLINLDQACESDGHCTNATANSHCIGGRCVCEPGHVAAEDQSKCLRGANYDEPCEEDRQCIHLIGPGAVCYSAYCTCDEKHFLVTVAEAEGVIRKICELHVQLGQYCREHNQCYEMQLEPDEQTMHCNYGQCGCKPSFRQEDSKCVPNSASSVIYCYSILLAALLVTLLAFL